MRFYQRKIALLLILLTLLMAGVFAFSKKKDKKDPVNGPDERKRAVHALKRLTFGALPGDVERVAAMGVDKRTEVEPHPDKIDDGALEARLAPFRTPASATQPSDEIFPPP